VSGIRQQANSKKVDGSGEQRTVIAHDCARVSAHAVQAKTKLLAARVVGAVTMLGGVS
jgi:hypothetical protein